MARHPGRVGSLYLGLNHWSERMVIGLVMQTVDNSLTVLPKRLRTGQVVLTSVQGQGEPNPSFIPAASRAYSALSAEVGGFPLNTAGEMVDVPLTAHFIGGCTIGDSPIRVSSMPTSVCMGTRVYTLLMARRSRRISG